MNWEVEVRKSQDPSCVAFENYYFGAQAVSCFKSLLSISLPGGAWAAC